MYHVKMIYDLGFELSREGKGSFSEKIDGILNFRILEVTPKEVKIGFQLSPIAIYIFGKRASELEKIYTTFFLASFSKTGKPIKFYFPNNISKQEEFAISEIVRGLQVNIPKNLKDKKEWTTKETNSSGTYIAHYTIRGNSILKKKLKYLNVDIKTVRGKAPLSTIELLHSKFLAKPSASMSWLERISGSENMNIKNGNVVWLKSGMKASLALMPFKPDPSLTIWSEKRDFNLIAVSFKKGKKKAVSYWEKKQREALKERLEQTNLKKIITQMVKMPGEDINQLHLLRDYFSFFPEKALEIPALFLKKKVNSGTAASVINALELSGTTEAQKALISIMWDSYQLPLNRIRAIIALGGIQDPAEYTLNALWGQIEKKGTDSLSIELSNTAALALKNISNALKVKKPDLSMKINSRLSKYSRIKR